MATRQTSPMGEKMQKRSRIRPTRCHWGSEEERAERWAERAMRAESLKVVYPVVDDGLDYAPSLKDLPVHERVFGRPPIALPNKEQQHEHQRHHQDVADHAGPLRTSHHL